MVKAYGLPVCHTFFGAVKVMTKKVVALVVYHMGMINKSTSARILYNYMCDIMYSCMILYDFV